jgi:hypothetical protein
MEKLTEELCGKIDHVICPDVPVGGSFIEQMPENLFTNCAYLDFFKARYFSGWFTVKEASDFLLSKKLNLYIKRSSDQRNIDYITCPKNQRSEGILFINEDISTSEQSNFNKCIWYKGMMINICGLSFYSVTNVMLLLLRSVKKRERKIQLLNKLTSIKKGPIIALSWADEVEMENTKTIKSTVRLNDDNIVDDGNEEIPGNDEDDAEDTEIENNVNDDDENNIYRSDEEENHDEEDDDDEEDEEKSEVDEVDFETESEDIDEICCFVPELVTVNNFNQMAELLGQFKNKEPDYQCLFNLLEISTYYLDLMDKSSELNQDCVEFIKKYTHFRHDVFNYIFAKEVIGVPVKFDSEEPIKNITSKKTPDLVLYTGNLVKIYEFTMVMSASRANFLKGVDKDTSVYKNEIRELELLGFDVQFYPIYLSLSDDLDTNISTWTSMNFNVNQLTRGLMEKLIQIIPIEYNYLLSLGFTRFGVNIDYTNAIQCLNNMKACDDNWRFEIVNADKRLFYQILNKLKEYNLYDNENYLLRRAKNNKIYMSITHPKNKNGFFGHKLKDIIKDDLSIYDCFKQLCPGRDKCYIKTRRRIKDKAITFKHGMKQVCTNFDTELKLYNYRNKNWFSMEESNEIDLQISKGRMNGLNTKNEISHLEHSLKVYEASLNKWMYETNTAPVVRNNPRRSFLCYIDSSATYEIPYTTGPVLNNIGVMSLKSNFAKAIYSLRKNISFKMVEQDVLDDKLERCKQYMRFQNAQYFEYLKKEKVENLKISHAKLLVKDVNKLMSLKEEARKAQKDYTDLLDNKGVNHNIINISRELSDLYKSETNWSSNSGYKLYMGKHIDLLSLMDDLKITTRPININMNVPLNENDSIFMKSLKEEALSDFKLHMNELMKTKLFNNCVFLSRLGYTLSAASNKTFNSKKILIDNLGLSDCMLLIKGGKKMSSTRKTKIFKLIYPCEETLSDWNPSVMMSNNKYFDETPWMQIGQNVLLDMIAAPYKLSANFLYLRERYSVDASFEIISMPTLLMFHNRRKTEILLHNMRYLCVNPISEYSQVGKMLEEFAQPSYTAFDFSIKHGIKKLYLSYYKTIREWAKLEDNSELTFKKVNIQHPYIKRNVLNVHDLTYIFYSTYLMSRGNYGQIVEQTNNLKSIMETHEYYNGLPDKHDYYILNDEENQKLIDDDFGYSPEFCYNVGKLLSSELRRKHATNAINIKWNQIMSNPVDDMANNRGLRDVGSEFFGHKGYYVIYKKLLENHYDKLVDLLEQNLTDQTFHKRLREINQTYQKEQEGNPLEEVTFHVVDKEQRGGGREIYVMNYNTKLYQNPIEKLFKVICEFIDNEIISIPSAKRSGLIHKKCFEYRSDKYSTYYMTYDCRKWAPRSNPDKYINMMLGMQDVLPQDFFLNTLNYFIKHSNKFIKTRSELMDKFLSNPENKKRYSKFMVYNEEERSAGFIMPYSFVMGIFNMLSSLLHAGGQLYAKYIIERPFLEKGIPIDFDMFAHSDDSGGRLSLSKDINDENAVSDIISNYEYIMKTLNHLMSTKKCNTSKSYFELLSILYLNHELLPLLPKFLGNIKMTVTGQGMSADFKQIISKSIELLSNGASATQAFKVQILLSNMYRNFYRVISDTQLPAFGGFANSWPTLYQTYGSAMDEIRLCQYNYSYYSQIMSFAKNNLDFDIIDGTINLKFKNVIRYPAAYVKFKKEIKLPEFESNQWFFEQNKTRHSLLNLLWFRAKLDSPNFAIAVLNINEIKRYLDSLYMASGHHIIGKYEFYNINELIQGILTHTPEITDYEKIMRIMYRDAFRLLEFIEVLPRAAFAHKPEMTTKPCTLTINSFVESPINKYNSLNLAVQICNPELIKYTFSNNKYGVELKTMMKFLANLGVPKDLQIIKSFLDFMSKVKNEVSHFYSDILSKNRALQGNVGCLTLIKECFSVNKQISNVNVDFFEVQKANFELDNKAKSLILLYYFYIIYVQTKSDEISAIPIKKSITNGELKYVRDIPKVVSEYFPYPQSLSFLQLMESDVDKNIILSKHNSWCMWTKKQGKIGDSWVGEGTIVISIDSIMFTITVYNMNIVKIRHKINESLTLSEGATRYFGLLMKEFNLNFLFPVIPQEGKLQFGINVNNQLGFYSGNNIMLGIQDTEVDYRLDLSIYDDHMQHSYFNGKHFASMHGINHRLYTFDEMIFNENKSNIFDTIEWSEISTQSQNVLMRSYFSGRYGDLSGINFDRDELIENFLSTDLYRLLYNQKKLGKSLNSVIWDDIMSNVKYTEDIFPTLYESMNIKELESILPRSRKDLLALFSFYDTDNNDLFLLRSKLKSITDEKERIAVVSDVMMQINDKTGIAALPDIGDPAEFEKFKPNLMSSMRSLVALKELSESMFLGFQCLKEKNKRDIINLTKYQINHDSDLLHEFLSPFNTPGMNYEDFKSITNSQIIAHHLFSLIISDRMAFSEFSRSLRNTLFRNVPRHPSYEMSWQNLIANIFKSLCINDLGEPWNILGATVQRYHMLENLNCDFEIYKAKPEYPTSVIPITLKLKAKTNDINFENVNFRDLIDNLLARVNTIDDQNEFKEGFIEYIEDCLEEDLHLKLRNSNFNDYVVCSKIGDLADYMNSPLSNRNKAVITCLYIPKLKPKIIEIKTSRLRSLTLFVYNGTIGKPVNQNYFRLYKEYSQHYTEDVESLPVFVKKQIQQNITLPISKDVYSSLIGNEFALDTHASYNENMVSYLKNTFKLDENNCETIRKIFKSRLTPIGKFLRLKEFLNACMETEFDLSKDLNEMLKKLVPKVSLGNISDEVVSVKTNLAKTTRNPSKAIESATTLKKEFKQGDRILNGMWGGVLVENIVLNKSIKDHLKLNIKLLQTQLRMNKLKQELATCSFILDIVENSHEGNINTDGKNFDEMVRELLTILSKNIPEVNDYDDSDMPEPEYKLDNWRFKIG